jgi:hypothetical protein
VLPLSIHFFQNLARNFSHLRQTVGSRLFSSIGGYWQQDIGALTAPDIDGYIGLMASSLARSVPFSPMYCLGWSSSVAVGFYRMAGGDAISASALPLYPQAYFKL